MATFCLNYTNIRKIFTVFFRVHLCLLNSFNCIEILMEQGYYLYLHYLIFLTLTYIDNNHDENCLGNSEMFEFWMFICNEWMKKLMDITSESVSFTTAFVNAPWNRFKITRQVILVVVYRCNFIQSCATVHRFQKGEFSMKSLEFWMSIKFTQ